MTIWRYPLHTILIVKRSLPDLATLVAGLVVAPVAVVPAPGFVVGVLVTPPVVTPGPGVAAGVVAPEFSVWQIARPEAISAAAVGLASTLSKQELHAEALARA